MTRIPDDHEASRALQEEFERLGRRRTRRARRCGSCRQIAVATLAALLAAAALSAATHTYPFRVPRESSPTLRPAPPGADLSPLRVRDPDGGLPWGARTYVDAAGKRCVVAGRVRAGRLGFIHGRRFVAAPAGAGGGACSARATAALVEQVELYPRPAPGKAVLYGYADRRVSRIALVRGRRADAVPIAPDGVFVVVRKGRHALDGVRFRAVVGGRVRDGLLVRP